MPVNLYPDFKFFLAPVKKIGKLAFVEVEGPANAPDVGGISEGDFSRPDIGATSGATVFNASGDLVELVEDMPDFSYGADGSCPKILMRPQEENLITNNKNLGAAVGVVGSGGLTPRNWVVTPRGLDAEIMAVGQEKGVYYVDYRIYGTCNQSARYEIRPEGLGANDANLGDYFNVSGYLKIVAQPTAFSGVVNFGIGQRSTAGYSGVYGSNLTLTSELQRFNSGLQTIQNPADKVESILGFGVTNGDTYDFTIRIGMLQFTEGEYIKDVIASSDDGTAISNTRAANTLVFEDLITKGALSDSEGSVCILVNNELFKNLSSNTDTLYFGRIEDNDYVRFRGSDNNLLFQIIGFGSVYSRPIPQSKAFVITWKNKNLKLYCDSGKEEDLTTVENLNISQFGKLATNVRPTTTLVELKQLGFSPFELTESEALAALIKLEETV